MEEGVGPSNIGGSSSSLVHGDVGCSCWCSESNPGRCQRGSSTEKIDVGGDDDDVPRLEVREGDFPAAAAVEPAQQAQPPAQLAELSPIGELS